MYWLHRTAAILTIIYILLVRQNKPTSTNIRRHLQIGLSMIAMGALAVSRPDISRVFLGGFILLALVFVSYQMGIR